MGLANVVTAVCVAGLVVAIGPTSAETPASEATDAGEGPAAPTWRIEHENAAKRNRFIGVGLLVPGILLMAAGTVGSYFALNFWAEARGGCCDINVGAVRRRAIYFGAASGVLAGGGWTLTTIGAIHIQRARVDVALVPTSSSSLGGLSLVGRF